MDPTCIQKLSNLLWGGCGLINNYPKSSTLFYNDGFAILIHLPCSRFIHKFLHTLGTKAKIRQSSLHMHNCHLRATKHRTIPLFSFSFCYIRIQVGVVPFLNNYILPSCTNNFRLIVLCTTFMFIIKGPRMKNSTQ